MQENIELKRIYKEIVKNLNNLIPEKWKSIYLYASVLNGKNGEMYFYYYPKKIIKSKPINCYEIAEKFGIDEAVYNNNLSGIYSYIRILNSLFQNKWTNTTIIIKENVFSIEYYFDDLLHSKYNDEQRRLIWTYKNLGIPLDSMSLEDKVIIESYKNESKINPYIDNLDIRDIFQDNDNNKVVEKNNTPKSKPEIKNPFLKY